MNYLNRKVLFSLIAFAVIIFSSCSLFDDLDPDPPTNDTGEIIWDIPISGIDSIWILHHTIAEGIDGSIYYAAGNSYDFHYIPSRIFALNKNDGSLKWKSEQLDGFTCGKIVVGDNGTLYVIGWTHLYAIDPSNGSILWVWEVPHTLPNPDGGNYNTFGEIGRLALTNNGDLVLGSIQSGVYSRGLYCIDKYGSMKWYNLNAVGTSVGSNITIGKNGTIYYYSDAGEYKLLAVNPESGNIIWTKEIQGWGGAENNISVDNNGDLICNFQDIGESDYHMYRINPANGDILWTSPFKVNFTTKRKMTGPEGYYYTFIDADVAKAGIYKIHPQNGSMELVRWTTNIGPIDTKSRFASHIYKDGVDKIAVMTNDDNIIWETPIIDPNYQEFMLLSDEKIIYGSTSQQHIFAIQSDDKMATSCWPRLYHDNRNTCNWNK